MAILLVALIVFGPRKLPELGKNLGAGLREFRRTTQGLKDDFEGVMREPAAPPVAAPVTVVTAQPQVVTAPTVVAAQSVAVAPVTPTPLAPATVTTASDEAVSAAVPQPDKQG